MLQKCRICPEDIQIEAIKIINIREDMSGIYKSHCTFCYFMNMTSMTQIFMRRNHFLVMSVTKILG